MVPDVFRSGITALLYRGPASGPGMNGDGKMARKKTSGKAAAYTIFNVTYEDGTVTSNRRVSNELLDLSFGDQLLDLARSAIQEQDNEIAAVSNQRRAKIKAIVKV